MSRFSKQSFFYQQKKRPVNKRIKKTIDTQSVLGDRRESILVFRPGAGIEEELGDIRLQAKSPAVGGSNRQRRPSSAASKKSSVWFPPIDPTGPHLTTNKVQLEEKLIEEEKEDHPQPNYKFNEIKIASTSILSNLARRLGGIVTGIGEIELPESLVNSLILSFNHLVADTIVEKREWQTDSYLDYERARKKKLFLINIPNQGDPIKQKVEASLSQFVKKQEKGRKRKRNMSNEKVSFERPHTAKSTASMVSMKSDVSEAESRVDYDKLPPELRTQGPDILRHRRESRAPKPKIPGPRTRLEKFNNMKMKAARERKQKSKRTMETVLLRNKPEKESEEGHTDSESAAKQAKGIQMINFSMSSKDCADYGWIVHPSKTADPEGFTLNQWATTKLQEAMRQREESYLTAKLRGEDGPLIIKYYSDPHSRPFKGVRQRTSSFPLPAILSKLPPSLATTTTHSHNEDAFFSPAEGQLLCLLVLPDGSGFCNYYSGRKAVSLSRKGDGSRGLYVIVFDDNTSSTVLASFMPDGRVCCYHKNGGLHLLADPCGGIIMDEDGFLARQWNWPQNGEKLSYSVSIQLNSHVLFQCSGKYQMTLRFSCHGQMHRFPVGLKPEFVDFEHKNEAFWMKRSALISSRLQSNLQFESDKQKDTCSSSDERESSQQRHRFLNGLPRSREGGGERDSLGASLNGSLSKLDTEPSRRELEQYKTKIKSVVDDWMDYYRQAIGIAPPSRHSSLSQSFPQHSSQGSRVVTSSSSHLHHSHPLSSTKLFATPYTSRPISPTALQPGYSPDKELLVLSRAASPLEQFVIRRPQSQESRRPFKVGTAKPKPRPDVSFRHGCPIALHAMMVGKLNEMPQCRCDRRKIPVIRDLEYDVLLTTHVPPGQLIIVFVTCTSNSSTRSDILSNPLLHSLHEKQNINRYVPCQQSSRDMFRILKYDLSSSKDDISTTRPLLVNRHDIAAGMFLMYVGGKLVGVFTGFNGYGTTKKDFLNQVQRSFENGVKGHFLPNDFKFSQSSIKLHSNSLWAYPVSGVLDELVSHTPSTATSSLTDLKDECRMDVSSTVGKTRGSCDHEKDESNFTLSEVNMGREY